MSKLRVRWAFCSVELRKHRVNKFSTYLCHAVSWMGVTDMKVQGMTEGHVSNVLNDERSRDDLDVAVGCKARRNNPKWRISH